MESSGFRKTEQIREREKKIIEKRKLNKQEHGNNIFDKSDAVDNNDFIIKQQLEDEDEKRKDERIH